MITIRTKAQIFYDFIIAHTLYFMRTMVTVILNSIIAINLFLIILLSFCPNFHLPQFQFTPLDPTNLFKVLITNRILSNKIYSTQIYILC